MRRHYLVASLVAASLTASLFAAAERVTFVLTNGERVSGTVVFHTEERTNIRADKNEFNVAVPGVPGGEQPIPAHQVAILEFIGGAPSTAQLTALSNDKHTLALRNGQTRYGKLIDLIGGDTVRWENENGNREDLPILQVARVYLNTEAARTVYNYQAPPPVAQSQPPVTTPAPGARGRGARGNVAAGREVRVNASAWTDTGIVVRVGQMHSFSSAGTTFFRRSDSDSASAAGKGDAAGNGFPVPSLPVGALIGRIGDGPAFAIGANTAPIRMNGTGRLMLGINDDNLDDNSGFLTVTVR